MNGNQTNSGGAVWLRYILIALICEKIIQHAIVTLAFYGNWQDIASTVVAAPGTLMVLGGVLTILFAVALWGMLTRRAWVASLVIGLALFDLIGEFFAQGTLAITITISFVVAAILLILGVLYRRLS